MRSSVFTAVLFAFCMPVFADAADMHTQQMHSDSAPETAHYTPIPDNVTDPDASHNVQDPDAADNVPDPDAAMPGDATMPDAIPNSPSGTTVIPPTTPAPGTTTALPGDPNTPQVATPPKPPSDSGDTHFDMVMLQGLNKVTARAESIEAPIGSVVRYGTIEIIAHKCWKADPDERPENAALLEVSEVKQGEAPQRIFSGWMFSSTPALSSLEHPFYDINVIGCGKQAAEKQ